MIAAASSACVVGRSARLRAAALRAARVYVAPPQNQRRPTVTLSSRVRKPAPQHGAHRLRAADGDEPVGLRRGEAVDEVLAAHAGVDEHGRRAAAEQGEDELHELDARRHEQHEPRAGADAEVDQAAGEGGGVGVELAKRARRVSRTSPRALTTATASGIWRRCAQAIGDVGESGDVEAIVAACKPLHAPLWRSRWHRRGSVTRGHLAPGQ